MHDSVPDMGVYHFDNLGLLEAKQILIDDPELAGLDDQARGAWDVTLRIYLPLCAIWRRDFDGLKENLQKVHHLYTSLKYEYPGFTEAQRRDELQVLFRERLKSCMPEVPPSRFRTESAKQPTLEEVIQRGTECILLLLAVHVAAYNSKVSDEAIIYIATYGVGGKMDLEGVTAYMQVTLHAAM